MSTTDVIRRWRWRAAGLLAGGLMAAAGSACGVEAPGADAESVSSAATAATAEPLAAHTLTLALPAAAADGEHAGAAAFEALVEGLSGGAVAVEVADRGEACGDPRQCLDALRDGTLDVTRTAAEDIAALFPEVRILDVPYLFEDAAVVDRVFNGPFYARLRDALVDRTGLRPMAIGTTAGWRTLATVGREGRAPADLRGLTLSTAHSPMEAELVAALGAVPAVGRQELAAELDRGIVDGVTLPLTEIVDLGLHQRIRHVTLDRHAYDAALWWMRDASHQALPAPLRQVVEAGFAELARLTLAVPADRHAAAVRAVEAAGGAVHVLSPDERKAFLMSAGRVATGYVETHGHEWLVWLEGAIADAERAIAAARDEAPADRP
ncbi:MAG: TRAP transporter substrate-binding protein DctP [Acidobacteria bacterium]|nr:TRAP transporter substrate-binding protein DctP [Acidobacteriota bacterium]